MLSEIFQVDHPHILNDNIPSNTMSDTAVIKKNIRNVRSTVHPDLPKNVIEIETHTFLDKRYNY